MKSTGWLEQGLVVATLVLSVGFAAALSAQDAESTFVPVTDEMLQNPPASEWLMFRRTLDSWGYSPWTRSTARTWSG